MKSKPGSRVTTKSCRIEVRNDLMLSEWRSWEIGTANTAKRREIVEQSPGEKERCSGGTAGARTNGYAGRGRREGMREQNSRCDRFVFKRFRKKELDTIYA